MIDSTKILSDDAMREAVRTRLLLHYASDRAAALYAYWQVFTTPGGPERLRVSLGPESYRAMLAALAAAGIELHRQAEAGPAAGVDAQPGAGASPSLTVEHQLVRYAEVHGVFAWGAAHGRVDLAFVQAGAPGYHADTLVIGVQVRRLLPTTFHRVEVRAAPTALEFAPPVLLRAGAHTDPAGVLRLFSGWPTTTGGVEAVTIFGTGRGAIEVVLYRCYDGPAAEDTSFIVARGVLT